MNEIGEFLDRNELNQSLFDDQVDDRPIFNGIFSFEGYNTISNTHDVERHLERKIKEGVERTNFVNHISLNEDIFIKNFKITYSDHGLVRYSSNMFSVFRIENLSFSYFISNLLSFLVKEPIEIESDLWSIRNF